MSPQDPRAQDDPPQKRPGPRGIPCQQWRQRPSPQQRAGGLPHPHAFDHGPLHLHLGQLLGGGAEVAPREGLGTVEVALQLADPREVLVEPRVVLAAQPRLEALEFARRKRQAVEVDDRRLAEFEQAITIPRQAVVERDGASVVYRKHRSAFRPVEVVLAATGLGRVVVTSGLEPGDVIALRDPGSDRAASGASSPHP